MRARTPMFLLAVLYLLAPLQASAAYVISDRVGIEPPFLRPTGSVLPVNDPQFFVASGTVADIRVAPESRAGLSGDERFFMQLVRVSDVVRPLDCKTPVESAVDRGISTTANDPDPATVDFDPFIGSECDIVEASSTDPISAGLYNEDGTLRQTESAGPSAQADTTSASRRRRCSGEHGLQRTLLPG